MTLADNILAQMAQIRMMKREPVALRCDPITYDCLIDEILKASSVIYPVVPPCGEMRVYGLQVEITVEPSFEVV